MGSIRRAQSAFYQATRGGGHGDYRMCVLAPSSVQEAVTLTQGAFDIADRYRNPVMVLGDEPLGADKSCKAAASTIGHELVQPAEI